MRECERSATYLALIGSEGALVGAVFDDAASTLALTLAAKSELTLQLASEPRRFGGGKPRTKHKISPSEKESQNPFFLSFFFFESALPS